MKSSMTPLFIPEPFPKRILYICDRQKCENCHPECKHTQDINHAKNFNPLSMENANQERIFVEIE